MVKLGGLSFNGRNKNTPDGDTTDAIRKKKARVKESQNEVHRSWDRLKFWRKKEEQQNIALTVPVTDQRTGELNNNLLITAAAQKHEHESGSRSRNDQYKTSTLIGEPDNSRRQKSSNSERGEYINSTGYDQVNIAGPSSEPTGTKRGLGHSRDTSRLPTKRIKHDDQEPRENELMQLQKEIDRLKAELRTSEDERAKAAQYMQQWETLQQEVHSNRRYAAQLKELKERAEQETQTSRHLITVFETKLKQQQEENLRVTSALQEKDGLLAEYRNDIAKLSNERPDSKRDDHYFEQHFSQLFHSIQNWVLQYYLKVNPTLGDLHPRIQEFLQTTVGQDGLVILQSEPVYTIQAYIASQMTSLILRPSLLGLREDSFEKLYNVIAPLSGGEELIKWRTSTIKMCIRGEEFANEVATKIGDIASELVASLATLLPDSTSPAYKPAPRTRKLKGILEQAAELALEVQQEPSTTTYTNIDPATICVASHVSDVKGLRTEDDLQASGVGVRLTVYPAVVRQPYNEPEGIVLMKAKVLAMESSDN